MSTLARRSPTPEAAAPEVSVPTQPSLTLEQPAPDVRIAHDSGTHHGIGDSVAGEPVTVGPVTFTPGECSALVDYVGPLVNLERFTDAQLLMIKALVSSNIEDAASWDAATGGLYSELAQSNESHFAGAGGFGANFAASMAMALATAKEALAEEEGSEPYVACMNRAYQHLYTAEHFLQDSFSAGHQVDPADIDAALDSSLLDTALIATVVPVATFAQASDVISCFGVVGPTGVNPIDTFAEFEALGVVGAALKGRDGVLDGLRKAIHERLEVGVEVSSVAHPDPWTLQGDHDLAKDTVGAEVLREALSMVRTAVSNVTPGTDPAADSRTLHDQLIPTPTGQGQKTVDDAVAGATADSSAVAIALTEAMVSTIVGVMQTLVKESMGAVVQLDELPEESQEHPSPTPTFPVDGKEPAPGTPPVEGPRPKAPVTAPDVTIDPVVDVPMGDQRRDGWWTDPDQHPVGSPTGEWAQLRENAEERPNPWWAGA